MCWLVLLAACGSPWSDTPADTPEPAPRAAPAPHKGSGFVYEGWPEEGIPVFTTTRSLSVALADRPGGPGAAPCTLPAGTTLEYQRSVVQTDRPGEIQLEEPLFLPTETIRYGAVAGLSRDQQYAAPGLPAPDAIQPEQRVEHLSYRAEGVCYYRVDGEVIGTRCFHDPEQAAETSWWIRTRCDGKEGWLRVDDLDGVRVERQF